MSFVDQLSRLDLSLFTIEAQLTEGDRRTLLLLQNVAGNFFGSYIYLEVGSHLGGSLLPHLLDPRCKWAISIDKRPLSQPDARGTTFRYDGNSTRRMLDGLEKAVPQGALLKLITFDMDVAQYSAIAENSLKPHLILIDAEHTTPACISDFLHARKCSENSSIFAFHDSNLLSDALLGIEYFLEYLNTRSTLLFLPDQVAVLLLDETNALLPMLRSHALDRDAFISDAKTRLNRIVAENVARRAAHSND
jgi:hypothetical protein